MQDVCIDGPVTLREEVAADLPKSTVALRILCALVARPDAGQKTDGSLVQEAFAIATRFLREANPVPEKR